MFRDKFSKTFEMCLVLNENFITRDKYIFYYITTKINTCIFDRLSQNNIKYHMKYTTKNTNINLFSCKAQKVAPQRITNENRNIVEQYVVFCPHTGNIIMTRTFTALVMLRRLFIILRGNIYIVCNICN